MAISFSLILISILVIIDMLCTIRLYKIFQQEKNDFIKDVISKIDEVRYNHRAYKMTIDNKIERAIYNYHQRQLYKKRKDEKKVTKTQKK